MGKNRCCLQPCQNNTALKLFKSVHTQATVLQSCQSKLLTLNLLKRYETKQLRTNFIVNLRIMLKKTKWWRLAVGEFHNVLRQFKFKFKFKYFNFCGCYNHVLNIIPFNIRKYIPGYEDITVRSRYLRHVYIITFYRILYDVITYPCRNKIICNWKSLRVLASRWVLEWVVEFWKTFPKSIHPSEPHDELCLKEHSEGIGEE